MKTGSEGWRRLPASGSALRRLASGQHSSLYSKYKKGDFPVAEKMAKTSLSLPVHEFIDRKHVEYMAQEIHNFYK